MTFGSPNPAEVAPINGGQGRDSVRLAASLPRAAPARQRQAEGSPAVAGKRDRRQADTDQDHIHARRQDRTPGMVEVS
jgi:hypothetical protein